MSHPRCTVVLWVGLQCVIAAFSGHTNSLVILFICFSKIWNIKVLSTVLKLKRVSFELVFISYDLCPLLFLTF